MQTAQHFTSRLGFEFEAYSNLETGQREVASQVVSRDGIRLVLQSALNPGNHEIGEYVKQHGDTIKDIAFTVDDCERIYQNAVKRGIRGISEPKIVQDQHGSVKMATLEGFGDMVHTLVERVRVIELQGLEKSLRPKNWGYKLSFTYEVFFLLLRKNF